MLSEETLRTSEIEFLRNIDLKGVHQDQNERRISIINNQKNKIDSQQQFLPQN